MLAVLNIRRSNNRLVVTVQCMVGIATRVSFWLPILLKMNDRRAALWTLVCLRIYTSTWYINMKLIIVDSIESCSECIVPLIDLFLLFFNRKESLKIWFPFDQDVSVER